MPKNREIRKCKLTIDNEGNIAGDTGALFMIWQDQKDLSIKMKDIPLCG